MTRSYDLRTATRAEILPLILAHHGYRSLGNSLTAAFVVVEDDRPVVGYAWQPPPHGAAKSVCPEAPHGVLALSRMVAEPSQRRGGIRRLKHISKPLRYQMRELIDRTRWPVLVTYSDEGQGHNGFTYKCSGWTPTSRERRAVYETTDGNRASSYSNGKHGGRDLVRAGSTWIQRWENWICDRGDAMAWMERGGWRRVALPGRVWRSGRQAHTYVREPEQETPGL